jgi:hypothetical protein
LKEDNPSDIVMDFQERDSESLKKRFQCQIQKKMNVYNRYYKQLKDTPISGVNTDEEFQKIVADNYRDAGGQAIPFCHCVEVLQQLPKLNPMVNDTDRSPEFAVEDFDGDICQ